jgi:hypothetical protein
LDFDYFIEEIVKRENSGKRFKDDEEKREYFERRLGEKMVEEAIEERRAEKEKRIASKAIEKFKGKKIKGKKCIRQNREKNRLRDDQHNLQNYSINRNGVFLLPLSFKNLLRKFEILDSLIYEHEMRMERNYLSVLNKLLVSRISAKITINDLSIIQAIFPKSFEFSWEKNPKTKNLELLIEINKNWEHEAKISKPVRIKGNRKFAAPQKRSLLNKNHLSMRLKLLKSRLISFGKKFLGILKIEGKNDKEIFFEYCQLGLSYLPSVEILKKPKKRLSLDEFFQSGKKDKDAIGKDDRLKKFEIDEFLTVREFCLKNL